MQTGAESGEPRQLDALADPGPPDHINPSLLIKPAPGNCTLGQPQAVFSTTLVADRHTQSVTVYPGDITIQGHSSSEEKAQIYKIRNEREVTINTKKYKGL